MYMEKKSAQELIKKYLNGTCTAEEKAIIESWYLKESAELKDVPESEPDYFEMEKNIWNELEKRRTPVLNYKRLWYSVAAAIIIFITIAIYFSPVRDNHQLAKNHDKNEIIPGQNKATLILADGSKIDLNSAEYGTLAKESGVRIRKTSEGQLVYDIIAQSSSSRIAYNTIETPKGGQYQVNLPDGTKVWLNAGSSLKFPTVFSDTERVVEMVGEAYFEVASDKKKPFKVHTAHQTVEVLGTHFNVNSYSDESIVKTTLLEGSIKVSSGGQSLLIKPGEQAMFQFANHHLAIQKVDAEEAIAWKNGYFQFNDESIKSIMRKISRWYDIEIEYQNGFVDQGFVGTISKYEDVTKVLKMLELTGTVNFKIQGRRITVMR